MIAIRTETWQEYLEDRLGLFRAYFYRYFWHCNPEEKQERIQEGLAQLCLVFDSEERRGRKPLIYWSVYAKRAASKVARGSSCTRPMGRNADLLDKTHCAHGCEIFHGVYPEDSPATDDHTEFDWLDSLSGELRPAAELLLTGQTSPEIRRELGISGRRLPAIRTELRESLSAYVA